MKVKVATPVSAVASLIRLIDPSGQFIKQVSANANMKLRRILIAHCLPIESALGSQWVLGARQPCHEALGFILAGLPV